MALKKLHIFRYLMILLIFISCIGIVSAATITVGDSGKDHTTINAAVTAANPGDTILVSGGTYTENVVVNKAVTIISENGSASTVVQSSTGGDVFGISSDNVTISGFNSTGAVSSNQAGIYVSSASNCNISNNQLNGNYYGINLDSSSNNTLSNNTANNNSWADIFIRDSSNYNNLTSNNASSTSYYGIYLAFSSNYNNLTSNNANNNEYGIFLAFSSNNNLTNNTASNNVNCGIDLAFSSYNTLTSNTASNNPDYGIFLSSSSNNTLISNTVSNNTREGIFVYDSSNNNTLTSNNANNNEYGIYLDDSSNNTLANNLMSSNSYNFGISASYLEDFLHDINESNLVDGKPLYYWINRSNEEVPSDAGAVYVINSTNITVKDIELANVDAGVLFAYTNNSTIQNVTVSEGSIGVQMISSGYNILDDITANNTDCGIYLDSSSYNALTSNSASSNNYFGIYFEFSSNYNTLSNTTAINNSVYDLNADSTSSANIIENLVLTNNFTEISFISDPGTGVKGLETVAATVSGKISMNRYVTIVNSSASPMNFTFYYNDSGLSIADESFVALYRLNGSEWLAVSATSLNTTDNYVSANLTEFGTFGLFTGGDISMTSSSSSPSSSSSSGGSVASRVISQGTVEQLSLGEDGEIMGDTVVKSSDTKATLTLYKGTVALDPYGNSVNKIMITVPASLPADVPEDMTYSGLYYEFGPSGTTVSKDVMITIDFDPEEFGGRVPTIYTYTSEGGWEALETTVDWDNGKATAMIRHFSMYALFEADVEEVEEIAVETPALEFSPVTEVETPVEDDTRFGYLYLIAGFGIVLVLGIVFVRKQKNGGEL
jgi:parallel beta-helix repeat protein